MLTTFFLTAIGAITGIQACSYIVTGKRGGQWRMPKREQKEKVACHKTLPSLKKEDLRRARGYKCPAKPQPRQRGNISRPRVLMR